jgi:RNA polymerase sigma factor (sigma-70 family)
MNESEAWDRHRAGDATASEWLVTRYQPLAKSTAEKVRANACTFGVFDADDYHATAMLGRWESICKFDGRCEFSSYAVPVIRGRVIDAIRAVTPRTRSGSYSLDMCSLYDEEIHDGFDIVEVIAKREYEALDLAGKLVRQYKESRKLCPSCKSEKYMQKKSIDGLRSQYRVCSDCKYDSRSNMTATNTITRKEDIARKKALCKKTPDEIRQIVEDHKAFIFYVVLKVAFLYPGISPDEFAEVAAAELRNKYYNYDETKGKFTTWARSWIRLSVTRYAQKYYKAHDLEWDQSKRSSA